MNLLEFKNIIDSRYSHCKNPEEVKVLITTADPSVGPRASCDISSIRIGFDWERNQLRLEPAIRLVREGRNFDDARKIYKENNNFWCPRCTCLVNKTDKYCRSCGQKLQGVKNE